VEDMMLSFQLKLEKRLQELYYWQDCYETLVQQYFKNDQVSNAGAYG